MKLICLRTLTLTISLLLAGCGASQSGDFVDDQFSLAAGVPVAAAGANLSINSPLNWVALTGSGTDKDGLIVSYVWKQISGPNSAVFNSTTASRVTASQLVPGTYIFQLSVIDDKGLIGTDSVVVTVLPPPANSMPSANAGTNQTIMLPKNSVTLSGSGADSDGAIVAYEWTQVSGPSASTLTNANSNNATAANLIAGTYIFKLTVRDNGGAAASAAVIVTVNAAPPPIAPVADAGPNRSITLPTNSIVLNGSATDADGTISAYLWTQTSGPNSATLTNANTKTLTAAGMVAGTYVFKLTATDNGGLTGSANATVIVSAAALVPPTANAGAAQTIQLPINTVTLKGIGTDTDGTIVGYQWSQMSGPNSSAIANGNAAQATVSGLIVGNYTFKLVVTDNNGLTGSDVVTVTVNPANKVAPIADAGPSQAITLPVNSVVLNGNGTDADGTVTGYAWSQTSGPNSATLTSANTKNLSAAGLIAGSYVFKLTVTDNDGLAGVASVTVTVNPAIKIPPVANAGANISITLPVSNASLRGSATDADGTIAAYAWTQVSGPNTAMVAGANTANLTVSQLIAGTYTFSLTVTDNSGMTATDTATVTVTPAALVPPTANAGAGQTITLPVNSVTLKGTGTDPDGTITAYKWSQESGPNTANLSQSTSAQTNASSLVAGTYSFKLMVTDNSGLTGSDLVSVTVNPAANVAPIADAGPSQSITLPANSVTLNGNGTDSDGTISSYSWSQMSGPNTATLTNANSKNLSAGNLVAGNYVFKIVVTDNQGATASATTTITVNPAIKIPPVANAGANVSLTLPTNSVTLNGSATDSDGTIASYAWSQVSGPSSAALNNANSANVSVANLQQGTYTFKLLVTDNSGLTASDNVDVVVNAAAVNAPPTASASANKTITLPTNSVTLPGSGADSDGTVVSYLWSQISGPSVATLTNATTPNMTASNLLAGTYVFKIVVTDNQGATGSDQVTIIVNPAPNVAPTAEAGNGQSITLPTNSVLLSGSGTDPDGTISSYAWTQQSGPNTSSLINATSANASATSLVVGTYVFKLVVTDNSGATGTDTVNIVVNPAPNLAPSANAGNDRNITLPTNSLTINGSGTDSDGTIASYKWTQESGPNSATLGTTNAAIFSPGGMVVGTYVFKFVVTDNSGASADDHVTVTVNPAPNMAPTASAGGSKNLTLPTSSITLTGSGNDSDGTIVSYVWSQVSGPNSASLTGENDAALTASSLVAGSYVFKLVVTDNQGATASDNVTVTVNPAPNVAPSAEAGNNQTITLPTNSVALNGVGTDSDGAISSYAWSQQSGPNSSSIENSTSPGALANGLIVGTYVFKLVVTDNQGATGTDNVTIVVNPAPNVAPTVNAGNAQTIQLPTNTVSLAGSGTDSDGTIVSYAWSQTSGPNTSSLSNSSAANATASGLAAGTYTFKLVVTDNQGATGNDTVSITVTPAPNVPPVANAGVTQNITLPTNSVSLTGSGSDSDGTISTYKWTQESGPNTANLANSNEPTTTASGLVSGRYVFKILVTDNSGATGSDTVTITVNPAPNVAPVSSAGADKNITLPTSTVTLNGSGHDPDGSISSYAWTQVSGPTTASLNGADTATLEVSQLNMNGSYIFSLVVTDNSGAQNTDTAIVTVNPEPANQMPTASAGGNKAITLPVDSLPLSGSATDSDGTISSYSWTQESGPSTANITNGDSASMVASGLIEGTYIFKLTVTDNRGGTGTDTVTVTVQPVVVTPGPPNVDAGPDQTVSGDTVTLSGSATDEGSIASYHWTQVSGGIVIIESPLNAETAVSGLSSGTYVFKLTARDNDGQSANDTVTITVNP